MVVLAALAIGGAAIAGAGGGETTRARSTAPSAARPSTRPRRRPRPHRRRPGGPTPRSGDEESYYEVEVTRDDGSQIDVQLDRQFNVVGGEADEESSDDDD